MDDKHDVTLVCSFCGSERTESLPARVKSPRYVPACRRCWPTTTKGTRVRYGAPERVGAEAQFYDTLLTRGCVYTVTGVRQWQHGREVSLEGFGHREFHAPAFVPVNFDKQVRLGKLSAYYEKLKGQVESHELDCKCEHCLTFIAAGTRIESLTAEEWPQN